MSLPASTSAASAPNARRADRFVQRDVLTRVWARVEPLHDVVVFDLDSTLLDNRPRQALIMQQFGASIGDDRIQQCGPEHWQDWSIEKTLARLGLAAPEIEAISPRALTFWKQRFFTSGYCQNDVPIPGAPEYVRRILEAGATVCYVTGRTPDMEFGTSVTLYRYDFPQPSWGRVFLLMKPNNLESDDRWKIEARAILRKHGRVVAAFDNEPSHINSYHHGFEGCLAVHLDTDHSERPIEVHPAIPSIRDFVI